HCGAQLGAAARQLETGGRSRGRDQIGARAMTARSLYFVNWWVDSLAIGGLSILTAIALLLCDASDAAALTPLVFPVAVLVNYPHFSATVYRLYQNPENLREFPATAIGLPVLL